MENLVHIGTCIFYGKSTNVLDTEYLKSILAKINKDCENNRYLMNDMIVQSQKDVICMLQHEKFSKVIVNKTLEIINLSYAEKDIIDQCHNFLDHLVQTVINKLNEPNYDFLYENNVSYKVVLQLLMEYLDTDSINVLSQYLHTINVYILVSLFENNMWEELEFLSAYENQIIKQTTTRHYYDIRFALDFSRFLQLFPQFVNYTFFTDTPIELFQLLHYHGKNLDYEFGTGGQFSVLHSLLAQRKYAKIKLLLKLGANPHVQQDNVSFIEAFKKGEQDIIEIYEFLK